MADMFAPLVAQLKANPKTIVFTEGNDPRILEAASKLLAEGVLKVVMVGNEAECKAAAAAGNFDISAAEIIDPENYAGFDEMVNTMVELRKGKQSAEECAALLKKSNYFGTMLVKMGKADCLLGGDAAQADHDLRPQQTELLPQPGLTGLALGGQRVAVLGRAAFDDVGDVAVGGAVEVDGKEVFVQQLAAAAHEGQALLVLALAGAFAHEQDLGVLHALPEHDAAAGGVQRTALAGEAVGFQCFPIHKRSILLSIK